MRLFTRGKWLVLSEFYDTKLKTNRMVVIWLNGGEGLGIVHGFLTKHCEKKRL